MTTITIKQDIALPKHDFKNTDELLLAICEARNMVILEEVDYDAQPKIVQDDLDDSFRLGTKDLVDFRE